MTATQRLFLPFLSAFLTCSCLTSQAENRWTPTLSIKGNVLRVNEQIVIRCRAPRAKLSPERRIKLGGDRLAPLLQDGLSAADVSIQRKTETRYRRATRRVVIITKKRVTRRIQGKLTKVTVNVPQKVRKIVSEPYITETEARLIVHGEIIAIAGLADAKAAGVKTPSGLAKRWQVALTGALKIKGLAVGVTALLLPPNTNKVLPFSGVAKGPITVKWSKGEVGPAAVTIKGQTIVVASIAVGSDTLILSRGKAEVTIDVAVQPYAAEVSQPATVEVTGSGPPRKWLGKVVALEAENAFTVLPGAQITSIKQDVERVAQRIGIGSTADVTLAATGRNMISVQRTVKVPIVPKKVSTAVSQNLLFSNNPENVVDYRQLFHARLRPGGNRVVFHHQNDLQNPIQTALELINDSIEPSRVLWVGGDPVVNGDPVNVGYLAVSEHWNNLIRRNGVVLTVPPRSRLPLLLPRVPSTHTVSGIMELLAVSGPEPILRITSNKSLADAGFTRPLVTVPLTEQVLSDVMSPVSYVYPNPNKVIKSQHTVGKRYAFIKIGKQPIAGITGTPPLLGNYGVVYDIEVTIDNPTNRRANVDFVFEPTAGLTGFVFSVEGKKVTLSHTNVPVETRLSRITLEPHTERVIRLKTIPLSGSNYPVQLTVRS